MSGITDDPGRRAFREFLRNEGKTVAQVARDAGLSNANALYNYLHGRSDHLSQATLLKIHNAYPHVSLDMLAGTAADVPDIDQIKENWISVKHEAALGVRRNHDRYETRNYDRVPLPVDSAWLNAGAFGAVIRRPGAERLFPEGTIVVCLPPTSVSPLLANGTMLLIDSARNGLSEVSLWQVRRNYGDVWLDAGSWQPASTSYLEFPHLEEATKRWKSKRAGSCRILGYVVASYSSWHLEGII